MIWKVPNMWEGAECWIIGGGPSLYRQFSIPEELVVEVRTRKSPSSSFSPYLSFLHDKHVIGVNNAYQLGPWIDVLFFGDCSWYLVHASKLSVWPGVKVTCCSRFTNRKAGNMEGLKYLRKDSARNGISSNPSTVCWNNNSGAAAISLAAHFGVRRIYLLGFDMKLDSSISHWHGSHSEPGKQIKLPPFARHLKGFPSIASDAKKRKIEILNVNRNSAISDFRKVSLKDVSLLG